ncbi:unnamed protein product [Rotaria magnacalcarata]|uniref:Uncharacterized protein n=1 Tax=Rotaria magnacalcarata TaxID=392030 RepID=A0A815MH21_9BILA|nr:unnamed protein product [Rotaria magnacalcarata]CAF4955464.1 unnamed protein product [Rotaria magnacalcarata]
MLRTHHFTILSFITFVILILLSECNSYPFFNELTIRERPTKYYVQTRVDRHLNRIKMKQYYNTLKQLKNWRRDIDESNDDDDATLQDMSLPYNNLNYKR